MTAVISELVVGRDASKLTDEIRERIRQEQGIIQKRRPLFRSIVKSSLKL
jgi:hypothetical protein